MTTAGRPQVHGVGELHSVVSDGRSVRTDSTSGAFTIHVTRTPLATVPIRMVNGNGRRAITHPKMSRKA